MGRRNDMRDLEMREARMLKEQRVRSQAKVKEQIRPFGSYDGWEVIEASDKREASDALHGAYGSRIGKNWLLMIVIAGLICKFSFLVGSVMLLVYGFYLMYCFEQEDEDELEEELWR